MTNEDFTRRFGQTWDAARGIKVSEKEFGEAVARDRGLNGYKYSSVLLVPPVEDVAYFTVIGLKEKVMGLTVPLSEVRKGETPSRLAGEGIEFVWGP